MSTLDLEDTFFTGMADMGHRLGFDPQHLMGVMANESLGVHANAHNPTGATGLIQFDNWDPQHNLIMPDGEHLTWQTVKAMSATTQLKYVEAFFVKNGAVGKMGSTARIYCWCFLPVQARSDKWSLSMTICGQRGPFAWAFKANPGFDHGRKGYITGLDMAQTVTDKTNAMGERWAGLVDRLNAAKAIFPTDAPPGPMGSEPPDDGPPPSSPPAAA